MEGGAKIFGVFRGKNHDFTPKNNIFSIAEWGAKIFGVFRVKNHDFTPKNLIFSNFRGGARRVRPPLDPPLDYTLTRVVIRVIITKINDNRLYDTSIYTVFFAVFFFNFDHMFFCFCQHIFCKFSESSIREFFYIF